MKSIIVSLGIIALIPFVWIMFMLSVFSSKNKYMDFAVMLVDNWLEYNEYIKEEFYGKEESGIN